MILTRKSSAWLLALLQLALAVFFALKLSDLPGVELGNPPGWLATFLAIQFGLAVLLAFTALARFEIAGMVLLFAVHTVCPILFFTDLTRNPYFTQIVLLNVWLAFIWIVWLWESAQTGKLFFPRTPLDLPLLCFLCTALLSWLVSFGLHPKHFHDAMISEGWKALVFMILNCYGAFYIAVSLEEKWRNRFVLTVFWVGTVAAVYGLMQFYGIERVWQKSLTAFANRPVSTFGNPNFLSSYLLLLIPLLIARLMLAERRSSALFYFVLLIVMITGVIATMTRSTWVGLIAALAVMPLSQSVRDFIRKHRRRLAVIAGVLVLCVLFWPRSKLGGYANPWERVVEIREIKRAGRYGPWHQRILIWSSSWMMVKDHQVLGKGWGLFELFYPYYQGRALFHPILRIFRTHANNCHNEVLEVWSQTGFVGMGIYLWVWVVLIGFGYRCAREFYAVQPSKSIWSWALTAGSVGMFVDNFFGNVSLHFAVPALLFWWQVGLLFALGRAETRGSTVAVSEWRIVPIQENFKKALVFSGIALLSAAGVYYFRREFQEIRYFRGFKVAKSPNLLDQARSELESAWRWHSREVNTNYELANTYARLSQQSSQMGLKQQSDAWRLKALWAYMESLRANCGYDEIYFNLAATQSQAGWMEEDFPDFTLQDPRGQTIVESAKGMQGAIVNYSRALAINPLSEDPYSFLGNVFLQRRDKYLSEALLLFQQGVRFHPRKKDMWLNLAYLQVQSKQLDQAYQSIKKAVEIDPFYEITRKNLRAVLRDLKRTDDPLARMDRELDQIGPLVQARKWRELAPIAERLAVLASENFQARFLLGNVRAELKEWEGAEREYRAAVTLEPANVSAWSNLSLVYRSTGNSPEFKKTLEKILELDGANAYAREQLQLLSQTVK